MKVFCFEHSPVSPATRYTINYLLDKYGFFYCWIHDVNEVDGPGIILYYGSDAPPLTTQYPVLYMVNEYDLSRLEQERLVWTTWLNDGREIPLFSRQNEVEADIRNGRISFDLIANVYFHLARIEELNLQHPDEVDQAAQRSALKINGGFLIPVVDILGDAFCASIEQLARNNHLMVIRKGLYPAGQEYAIALTHDVDFVRAFHPLKKQILRLLIRLGLKKDITLQNLEERDQEYWGFDNLLALYKTQQLQATFFFLARYRENRHFRYRIASHRFKRLFKDLRAEGHEIALHPSRYAFENPGRYAREKKKLQRIAQTKIIGMRHHYLRCLFPRIWNQAARIGLSYDAGMVYRHFSGFRAGTCHPFEAFDHSRQSQTGVIEFPTAFFENTLPEKGINVKASEELIQQLLLSVKRQGGLFNILWHSNNLCQPKAYEDLWNFITALIDKESAYNHPLIEQYQWYRQRKQISICSIHNSERKNIIRFDIPEEVQRFCLHVPGKTEFFCNCSFSHDPVKNLLIVENGEANKDISIEVRIK